MKTLVESELLAGDIFGDVANKEFVYMPSSEIGLDNPILIFECHNKKEEVNIKDALKLITRYNLKKVVHPKLGDSSI